MHHLQNDIIDGYVNREIDGKTLARIDAHVSGCLACATTLSERASAADQWERRGLLGRLVRIERREAVSVGVEERETEAAAA